MKYLIVLLILSLPKWGNSQNLFLIEDEVMDDDTKVTALIIRSTDDFDEAMDNFKDFVKDKHDLKVKKENNQTYMIEAVELPHLSIKRGDLKIYLKQTDSTKIMAFSFRLGYDISINSEEYPEEMTEFKKFVLDYMEYNNHEHYMATIEEKSKLLDKSVKELRQNEDKIGSLQKKVGSLDNKYQKETDESKKTDIASDKNSLENEIETLTNQLPELRESVSEQEEVISGLKEEMNNYHQEIMTLQSSVK